MSQPARIFGDAPCEPTDDGCLTCGDNAIAVTVAEAAEGDAWVSDDTGHRQLVATDLVGPVEVGDRLLTHAGVAIARLVSAGTD